MPDSYPGLFINNNKKSKPTKLERSLFTEKKKKKCGATSYFLKVLRLPPVHFSWKSSLGEAEGGDACALLRHVATTASSGTARLPPPDASCLIGHYYWNIHYFFLQVNNLTHIFPSFAVVVVKHRYLHHTERLHSQHTINHPKEHNLQCNPQKTWLKALQKYRDFSACLQGDAEDVTGTEWFS